ncbi:MMPL family transporter [Phycicoccus sp. Root101]|uniref:MMPL family transporter n=1 Tax=Phycicoccus sp. Root101 TaxID=1736421 RepID=UPI0009E8CE9D|nr:MMPL family transporter [Phycicoccus sp. Root101]
MSRLLHRLGRGAALHPWLTIATWLVVAGTVAGLAGAFGGTPHDDYNVPGARAQVGIEQLRAHLPGAGNTSARVVVHDRTGAAVDPAALTSLADRLRRMPHVVTVAPPALSDDGDTALVTVGYDAPVTDTDLMGHLEPLDAAVAATRAAGLQVELGGELPESAVAPMEGRGELIGIVAALVILVFAFGSVTSAGLPIGTALVGLGVGSAGITLLAAATDVSTAAPMVATMVGLGVGIDYALLLVTRHVEYLREGLPVAEAAGRACATAGRSIVFAASTVLVSLMGLRLAGLPVYSSFGFATAIAVVAVAAASLTLVPVLARFAGLRLLPRRVRPGRVRPSRVRASERARTSNAYRATVSAALPTATSRTPLTARWAARVGRNPLPWAAAAAVLMLTLAIPAMDMRTWPQDASSGATDLTTRRAYDLVAAEYGAGANGPLTFVVDRSVVDGPRLAAVRSTLEHDPDISAVTQPTVSPDGAVAVFDAVPAFGPTDHRTSALVDGLRAQLPDGVELTGTTAFFSDIAGMLADRLWLVIAFVVSVSVLLLAMVFRSVVVPLKAAVMNLLSIGAAYGVLTAVFQWGWGASVLGLDHPMAVSSWVPILMFAILFGLSMDYEVFLLSQVREDWLRTGDAHGSVVRGLSATGRVISSAAAIMVAVFLGFATEVDAVVKMLGVGMAAAILLDATVIRMVLVPATMSLLGERNWWVPGWLDRVLPTVRAEVELDDLGGLAQPAGVLSTVDDLGDHDGSDDSDDPTHDQSRDGERQPVGAL